MADLDDMVKLQESASKFLKIYTQQHCAIYADLQYEIEETKMPPKPEVEEGEEPPEEESKDRQERRQRNEVAQVQLDIIKEPIFAVFIKLCQTYADQINQIVGHLKTKQSGSTDSDFDLVEELDRIAIHLDRGSESQSGETESSSLQKNVMLMLWYFDFIEVEISKLDDISQGLKIIITAMNAYFLFIKSLDPILKGKASLANITKKIEYVLRMACYTLGIVSNKLITSDDKEKEEEESATKSRIDFTKLIILQGGLENRFIPELSKGTKTMIQGFFRITQDEQLKALAEQEPSDVVLTEDDQILDRIVSAGVEENPDHLSLDGINYIEQTI